MTSKRWTILLTGCVAMLTIVACGAPERPAEAPVQAETEVEMDPKAVELA